MVLSIPLIISLSFTLVIGILLFLYIRQKTSSVDMKINTLMQFIQDEATKREAIQASQQSAHHLAGSAEQHHITNLEQDGSRMVSGDVNNAVGGYLEKIEVSDDEESEYYSDSDSQSDDGESSVEDLELLDDSDSDEDSDASSIEEVDIDTTIHLEEINTLSTNTIENELHGESNENNLDIKTVQLVAENDNQSNAIEATSIQIQDLANEIATTSIEEVNSNLGNKSVDIEEEESLQVNLKSLKVSKLRELALEKNLVEDSDKVKKMKKNELLEILGN